MPFTLAHPAAVLPFTRRPWNTAALVAGAIAPDLPYFARATPIPVTAQSWYEPFLNATTSHSLAGSVTVGLPFAALVTAVWWASRRPLGSLLVGGDPTAIGAGRQDVEPWRSGPRDAGLRGAWLLVSLLVGIATHLAWDSFTHGDGVVVAHVPALSATAIGGLTWARLLQHVSTVVGLVVLGLYLWRRRAVLRVRPAAVWVALGVTVAGAGLGTLLQWGNASGSSAGVVLESLLRAGAQTAGVALGVAAVVYVLAWWTLRGTVARRRPRAAA